MFGGGDKAEDASTREASRDPNGGKRKSFHEEIFDNIGKAFQGGDAKKEEEKAKPKPMSQKKKSATSPKGVLGFDKHPPPPPSFFDKLLGRKEADYHGGFFHSLQDKVQPHVDEHLLAEPWPVVAGRWASRLVCLFKIHAAVSVLFFHTPSWEKKLGPLSAREAALSRAGAVLGQSFELALFGLVLAVSELGDPALRKLALGIATAAIAFTGPYGLPIWLGPHGYSQAALGSEVGSGTVLTGALVLVLCANLTDGFKTQRAATFAVLVVGGAAAAQTLEKNNSPLVPAIAIQAVETLRACVTKLQAHMPRKAV